MELGKPIRPTPVDKSIDVWQPHPTNKNVEINQHGIYRTIDLTPIPMPLPPDAYYGWPLIEQET
jgi:hypothetical protein